MDWRRLRATLRFDGAAWRRFAELGCVYGPEWWKRGSPPVIAAIIFAIARAQRAAVLANQRQVRGPVRGPRGWLRERWHAYRVFAEFARSVTEAMEQWGPRPRPVVLLRPLRVRRAPHPAGAPPRPDRRHADRAVGPHAREPRGRVLRPPDALPAGTLRGRARGGGAHRARVRRPHRYPPLRDPRRRPLRPRAAGRVRGGA